MADFDAERWFTPKDARTLDRFAQFSVAVAEMALIDAGELDADPGRSGVIMGTGVGGLQSLETQILVFATMAFLWFVGVVRGRLGDAEPKLFGTAFFGGAILLGGTLLVGASALAAPSLLAEVGRPTPEPGAVAMSRAMAVILLTVMAPRAATLVIFSTAALGRATGALPTWLVWLSYAIGTIEFINVTLTTPTIYVFPAWIALVSVDLLIRRTTRDDAASPVVAPG